MAARRKTAAAQPKGDYEVGYGRPPKSGQFKPGQSGNSRGRPKGAKNKVPAWGGAAFDELIQEEAYRPMTINDNGRSVTMPVMRAVIRRITIDAMQGRARAQKLLGDFVGGAERRGRDLREKHQEALIGYKNKGSIYLEECRRAGKKPPEMIPHPDDIIIDPSDGEPVFYGPMTAEDKVSWDILAKRREDARRFLAEWEAELKTCKNKKRMSLLKENMEFVSERLEEVLDQIGEWPHHRVSGSGDIGKKLAPYRKLAEMAGG